MRIHFEVANLGGGVERAAEFLERHVDGNVDEILAGGGGGAGDVEERVDTESRVASLAAGSGYGLGGAATMQRGGGGGAGIINSGADDDDEEGGGDGGGREECGGNDEEELEGGCFGSAGGVVG